jgi:hypothetical protein
MRSAARLMKTAQLSLFHPPQASIRWEALPKEIQQQSVGLLARLLRAHARNQYRALGKELGDE